MPSVTVRIPDSLRTSGYIGEPINAKAKARLSAILTRQDLVLGPQPLKEVAVHANFWLNAADEARLAEMGAAQDMSVGETITALLVQDAQREAERGAEPAVAAPVGCPERLERALRALGLQERAEQSQFYRALQKITEPEVLQDHRILMAEAGTGTGKTLAYLVALHAFRTQRRSAPVAIAVPSHALMEKVLHDWQGLMAALQAPIDTVALLGQGEFVSQAALQGLLETVDDVEVRASLEAWMAQGAPPPPDSLVSHRWSMAGLRHAAPTFRLSRGAALDNRDSDNDPGYLAYRHQWAGLAQSGVIVMTHAMLASLTWRRAMAQSRALKSSDEVVEAIAMWSATPRDQREQRLYEVLNAIYASTNDGAGLEVIPNLGLLVVDEAHQLEESFALVLSRTVSIWALRRDIKALHELHPKVVKRSDVDDIDAVWGRLRSMGDVDAALLGEELKGVVKDLGEQLSVIAGRKGRGLGDSAQWRRLQGLANALRVATLSHAAGESYVEVMVTWSPDRMWPQLTVGRLSYAREMHFLWTNVAERAILVSGTLYEELPQLSCEAVRRALNVPFDSMMTMEPVHAQWQYTPVTVCMVGNLSSPGGRPRFLRPRQSADAKVITTGDDVLHEDWCRDIAGYILEAHREGAGGMLVLGTAFRDLHAIAAMLRETVAAPVLEHRPGLPLATLREQFLALAEDRQRPILLAAGGAWTGFDLHSATQPDALTDLVMINAPFGATTRTLAREVRMRSRGGFNMLVSQVTVLVRQGLGRLVRSPDTPPNRRIHWLDAKIHHPTTAGLLNPVRRVLAKYRQITVS